MATQYEWQVVRRHRRYPDGWRSATVQEATRVKAYTPYYTKPSYIQIVTRLHGFDTSRSSPRSYPTSSGLSSPRSSTDTHCFVSPHSPLRLRFSPSPSLPKWRGRCFRCCCPGHTATKCRNACKCGKCWQEGHIASSFPKPTLNPEARPFHSALTNYKPTEHEAMFDELLTGQSKPDTPTLLEERPDKIHCFIDRDDSYFQELSNLNRAVVMHTEGQRMQLDPN